MMYQILIQIVRYTTLHKKCCSINKKTNFPNFKVNERPFQRELSVVNLKC